MRPLPLIVHVGRDFDSDENQDLRDQYDKLQNQGGR
jgi:hypothetical protein